MTAIKPDEITSIIKSKIENYSQQLQVDNVGSVIEISDGISRIYGLKDVMSSELVEFDDETPMANYTAVVKNSSTNEVVSTGKTDSDGIYTWTASNLYTYYFQLTDMPVGYEHTEVVFVNEQNPRRYTIVTCKVLDGNMPKNYKYSPGEVMYDFTLTDYKYTDTVYNFRDLLEEKKFIMLNFFYIGCPPCQAEFPAIEKAYQKYQDKMEILAIDVYSNQTPAQLDTYRTKTLGGISFPMCFEKTETLAIAFNVAFVPTTAIIDRYGRIDLWTYGTDTSQASWERKFAKYSDPDYVPGEAQWDTPDWTDKDILGH